MSAGIASFNTTSLSVGSHNLSASYAGDAGYLASASAVVVQTIKPTPAVITASASNYAPALGAPVTLTATATGNTPTGTVTFIDTGGVVLGSSNVAAGTATLSVSFNDSSLHRITASYAGDPANGPAISSPIVVRVSAANVWSFGYDPKGNLTSGTDPNGRSTLLSIDTLDRATTVARPALTDGGSSTTTGMAYNGQDRLTGVTDPRSLSTAYTVDGLGQVKTTASPDSGTATASFDTAGNPTSLTDARGKVLTLAYDDAGRLVSITPQTGTARVIEYDGGTPVVTTAIGKVSKLTDESGSTSYTYDTQGRLLTKTQVSGARTFVVSYAWGNSGSALNKLTAITYPSGNRLNYSYDALGRISAVTFNPVNANGVGTNTAITTPIASGLQYRGPGTLKGWTWSDGTPYSIGFDAIGRANSYPLGKETGSGTALGLKRTLGFDNAGLITAYTHTNNGTAQASFDQSFSYDGLSRLTQASAGGTSTSYGYDSSDNRTLKMIGATSLPSTLSPTSNRLLNADAGAGSVAITHDAAGHILTDGIASYTYSDFGRMSSATVGANTVSYKVNALEQRVSKTGPVALVPTGAAYFVHDEAGRLLGEYDASGYPVYETAYLEAPIAVFKFTGTGAGANLASTAYNAFADQLGAVRVITRPTDQAIVWRWDQAEPFGASAANQNPNGLGTFVYNPRHPGQVFDAETGQFQNWHREYNPRLGRYLQADPLGLVGGINTFLYANAAPTMYTDPEGFLGRGMPSGGAYYGKGGPQPPCTCPTPPLAPTKECLADNIDIANDYPAWNPGSMLGLYENVRNYGPWDYKRRGSQYTDFGNFNFGAVTAAMGVPVYAAQNGAGIYQQLRGAAGAGRGTPFLVWPYGDDPADAVQIERGRRYAECRCK